MISIVTYGYLMIFTKVVVSTDPVSRCTAIPTHHFEAFLAAPAVKKLKGVMQHVLVDADDSIFTLGTACACDLANYLNVTASALLSVHPDKGGSNDLMRHVFATSCAALCAFPPSFLSEILKLRLPNTGPSCYRTLVTLFKELSAVFYDYQRATTGQSCGVHTTVEPMIPQASDALVIAPALDVTTVAGRYIACTSPF